jgi:outer membrane protein assembly factor BamB
MTSTRKIPVSLAAMGVCLALAAGLTACGAGDDPAAGTAATKSPAVKDAPHFDPPVRFGPAGRPLLVPEPDSGPQMPSAVLLSGPTAYYQSRGGLYAADVRSGAISWTARPRTAEGVTDQEAPPVLATMGGRRLVVDVFNATIPGQGTTPAQPAVEVLAVDPATGRPVLDDTLPLPPSFLAEDGTRAYSGDRVVAADDKAIVIKMHYSEGMPGTLVVDPATHRIRWSARGMDPVMASNGQLIATALAAEHGLLRIKTYKLQAIDTATKAVGWSTKELWGYPSVSPAGPGLAAISRDTATSEDGLLDVSTGKQRAAWPKPIADQDEDAKYECVHDDRSVTVCFAAKRFSDSITGRVTTETERILAYDTATARLLWELPKAGRVAPTITTVWHGAVYGTTANGPVVLDARTGQDRETAPGVAPVTVGAYGALVKDDNDSLMFHAAAG